MGSAYHTIHHTTYVNNYGQIFLFFDWIHETMVPPPHRIKQWGWTSETTSALLPSPSVPADSGALATEKKTN
jgi:sterol desaturase/sphingolipid hydroxylase (fatty acid hydroxylase superfamily)